MSLWEGLVTHAVSESDLVLVSHASEDQGKSCAAPYELEVRLSLFLGEKVFKDSPEPANDLMVLRTSWVRGDRLQGFNVQGFLTTCSYFNLLPAEVGKE